MKNLPRGLFLATAVSMLVGHSLAAIPQDPTSDGIQFGGLSMHKPGLKVRATQAVSDMIKENLLQYGQAYMNFDLQIPQQGIYEVNTFPVYTDVFYSNLHYDPFQLDLEQATFNFTRMVVDDAAVVYMELPVVNHWRIAFDYVFKILFKKQGHMELDFRNTGAIATTELFATTDGHLFCHLHDLEINIEDSILFTDKPLKTWWYRQFFNLGKYIIQSSYNMFGASMINKNLYPITKKALNNQIYEFPMEFKQLDKSGDFNLNWRMTADPYIHNKQLDFSFFFDIGPELNRCLVPADQHNYYFQDNFKNKYLQMILSDRVPNCMMEAMERQDMLKFTINTEFMIKHFGTHRVPITAALFKQSYPKIAEVYGDDQELEMTLEFRMPRVEFGATERDMQFTSTVKFGVRLANDLNFLVFDELDFFAEGDISIEQEVLIGSIETMNLKRGHLSDQTRDLPIYNTIDIFPEDYENFWKFANESAKRWQDFFNNRVLSTGIPLPYWNLEFITKFTFHPHAVIVVMDVFYNTMDLIDGTTG